MLPLSRRSNIILCPCPVNAADHANVRVRVHSACPYPCCMPVSMLHAYVHAACQHPCCMSMSMVNGLEHTVQHGHDMQRRHGHAAWTWTCSMDMSMCWTCCMSMPTRHVQVHATSPHPYLMELTIHIGQGHAAWTWACSIAMDLQWTWTCSMGKYMLLIHVNVHLPINVHSACPSTCCISQYMRHVPEHAAYPSTCCMSSYMLRIQVHAECPFHAAYLCVRFRVKSMLCMDTDMHGHGYVAWTCSMDM